MSTPRPLTSRRALLHTAAWSVPTLTVASAAPAFANSPGSARPATECTVRYDVSFLPFATRDPQYATKMPPKTTASANLHTASWEVEALASGHPAGTTAPTSTITFDVAVDTATNGSRLGQLRDTDNSENNGNFIFAELKQHEPQRNKPVNPVGDKHMEVPGHALKFGLHQPAQSTRVNPSLTVTMRFEPPVKNLSFVLTDIDGNSSDQTDRLTLHGATYAKRAVGVTATTSTAPATGNDRITYTATASNEWTGINVSSVSNADNANTRGNIRFETAPQQLVDTVSFSFANVHDATRARTNTFNVGSIHWTLDGAVCTPSA